MIRELLLQEDINWRSMGHINPFRTLVLEKGRVFVPAKYRGYGRRKAPQQCWSNALKLTMIHTELRYVEGLGISGDLAAKGVVITFPHAWCIDDKDRVVDPTWANPDLGHYMGVIIPTDEAWDYVVNKGYYGVLNNYGGEMIDIEAIEHFFPEYKGRDWRAEAEAGKAEV